MTWFFQLTAVAVLLVGLLRPPSLQAHGELHLRIQEITRRIQTATTNRAYLYFERGELQREHGEWEAAVADFDQAAKLDPDFAAVDFGRARLLVASDKPTEAKAMFDKGLAREPGNGEALVGRARVLLRLAQTNAAVADFRRGLQLLPDPDPEYFLDLARTLAGEGRFDQAIASIDAGVRKIGSMTRLESYALELEIGQKMNQAALSRLDRIIQNVMRKESWLARRGEILLFEGRKDEARKAFQASLDAIKILPPRLQQSPGMLGLRERLDTALKGIESAPANDSSAQK